MTNLNDIDGISNVLKVVEKIALPDSSEDLRGAHTSWFLCLQNTMKEGGYSAVKIKFPGVSENFATGIAGATFQQLLTLCNGEISLLKPSIGDKEMLDTLSNTYDSSMLLLLKMLHSEGEGGSVTNDNKPVVKIEEK